MPFLGSFEAGDEKRHVEALPGGDFLGELEERFTHGVFAGQEFQMLGSLGFIDGMLPLERSNAFLEVLEFFVQGRAVGVGHLVRGS